MLNKHYRAGALRKGLRVQEIVSRTGAGLALAEWIAPTDLKLGEQIQKWGESKET